MQPLAFFFSLAILAMLTPCTASPLVEGQFDFGNHSVRIKDIKSSDLYGFLAEDWAKFNKHVKDAPDRLSGKVWPINWHMQISPPFPTNWPPRKNRSVTYYAYAEYQELLIHGPALSRSAPWVKVILSEGMSADKVILASALGPAIHGEGSVPISGAQAARKIQIIGDGEAHLADFIAWKSIPADEGVVIAIKNYYCQWILTNRTADLIKEDHRAFFEWLSCPPRTMIPVLP